MTYAGVTAIFNPATDLAFNTTYTATITTGARDLAGNPLANNHVWSFTTGAAPDTLAPTVTLTVPINGATGVAIGNNLSATFSEAMDPLTLTNLSFSLASGGTAVAGSVTYAGVTAIFNPATDLAFNTTYTATITTGARDLAGNPLASNHVWSFTTGAAPDTTAPTVTLTVPINGATGVAIGNNLSATFSEAMDPLTLTNLSFSLASGGTAVAGSVTYAGVTAIFNPATDLAFNTTYTATVTTAATDLAGNPLASNHVWSFTTGAAPDTLAPTVTLTAPLNGASGLAIGNNITATFSEAMDPLSITNLTFTLSDGVNPVAGAVTYSGVLAVFNPLVDLAASTTYTATVTTAATDLAGNPLASNHVWSFTTGVAADTTPPTVTSTVPIDLATGVAISSNITATFSEAMDPLTLTTLTFTLKEGVNPVAGAVTYIGNTANFNPTLDLAPNTLYTATITTGATDLGGNPLASDYIWEFTTVAALPLGPPPVILGLAENFAGLSKAAITDVPASIIIGDLGVSPISGAAIGVSCAEVTGNIYAVDAAGPLPCTIIDPVMLTTAVSNLETAYTDAAGRPAGVGPNLNLGSGTVAGQTLAPGTYTWGSNVTITTDLTLNGGPNDTWLFQITGTLDISPNMQVLLTGGALPKNIFWQVSDAVTLGTGSHFEGNILAQTNIAMNTGSSINGRLLAQTAVSLDHSTVIIPAP
ncbi:repeat-containing protein [Desulfuromonas sp. DDH964]|uniref:Ig-like domain-containing protein n=1 Tax=Desulfuromonas sp. DDH964 TaxID=1823759 RepID=UPI00078DD54B|nr:Ig-like domain-containing protein [Desulfuromonas sp. DDH964]AMV73759.1 repeat-containing protein [Desulfuromonas sp. DDH964]